MSAANGNFELLPGEVTCIDTGLFGPRVVSAYLVEGGGEYAIIETGATKTVPRIMEVLAQLDVPADAIRYVIPTHVHLDHAGGAGELLRRCENATLIVHPRGARHMIDPSKLWAGAAAVYGEAELIGKYGRPVPVDESRMVVAEDGFALDLGGRRLLFIDTPGHARHHFSVWDDTSRGFFTGDTFGVSYRQTDSDRGAFIMPTTTPVQFDPDAWHGTLDRYASFNPERMFLTHYAMVEDVQRLGAELRKGLDFYSVTARECAQLGDRFEAIKLRLVDYTLAGLADHGCGLSDADMREAIEMDMELNAQGLEVWLDTAA